MSAPVATKDTPPATPPHLPAPPTTAALVKSVVTFRSVDDLRELARMLYMGGITPEGVDRPEKLVPIILAGMEVGLGVMQAVKSIYMVKGRCEIFGDAGLALVRQSGKLASLREWHEGDGDDRRAICEVQRVGGEPKRFEFTMGQAKRLASYKKAGDNSPWKVDPDNMLHWRALWRALRKEFGDVLAGLAPVEEEDDGIIHAEVSVKPATAVPAPSPAPSPSAPPAAPVATPAASETVPADVMITEEQLSELAFLRTSYLAAKYITDPTEVRSAWAALLAPYSVDSAKKLTREQADLLIDSLAKVHDLPPFSARSKAA